MLSRIRWPCNHCPQVRSVGGRALARRLVCIGLGLLLLAAAYLKLRDLTWEPFGKAILVSPRLRIIFVEAEAILGLWLLLGIAPRTLWMAATVYFTTLAGVSVYLASHGEPTCGCFGQTTISPWITFGVDVVAIAALALTRPALRGQHCNDKATRTVFVWAGVALVAVLIIQLVRFGGATAAWAAMTAHGLAVDPDVAHVGSSAVGDEVTFAVTLRNQSSQSIHVIGGTNNCVANCMLDLPVVIPPRASRSVRIRAPFRGAPGKFAREYSLISDLKPGGVVTARFTGMVLPRE